MAMYAPIGEFNPAKETWSRYIDRLSEHFVANDIEQAEKKRAILNTVVGSSTYGLFCKLLAPRKPSEATFEEIKAAMDKHSEPAHSTVVERYKFSTMFQKDHQTIAEFAAELQGVANRCDFQDMKINLRDRFVVGISDAGLRKALLNQGDKLTFDRVLELAQQYTLAELNARTVGNAAQTQNSAININTHRPKSRRPRVRGAGKPQSRTGTQAQDQHGTSRSNRSGTGSDANCYRCAKPGHKPSECWALEVECYYCKQIGHTKQACRKRQQRQGHSQNKGQTNYVANTGCTKDSCKCTCQETPNTGAGPTTSSNDQDYGMYKVNCSEKTNQDPIMVSVNIHGKQVQMEVDTGAGRSIVSEQVYQECWGPEVLPLQAADLTLHTYTGDTIQVLGKAMVDVKYNDQNEQLILYVVAGEGPNLFGRNWLEQIKLEWHNLFSVYNIHATSKNSIMEEHAPLFQNELGKLKGYQAHISITPEAQPRFCKARQVPYALKDKVGQELHRLENAGVIERVTFSQWATPIVPVLKQSGDLRICGDFRATVNPVSQPDQYPLPRVEEVFTKLSGGKLFTKLDLSSAYQQLELDEQSRELCTINTHLGLFQYKRCPYGISTAPSLFQRTMDSLLADIPHTAVFLDDVLVTGATPEEHMTNLEIVLSRMEEAGLRLNPGKCVFFAPEVIYLGHKITEAGLQPIDDKVQAIVDAPPPKNTTELKSFLGLLNYCGKFIPNLASLLAALHILLRNNHRWSWNKEQQDAFEACKIALTSASVLVHYDPEKPMELSCDASPYGVGAVLSQIMDDGFEHPVAFASRSLHPAECNYSQLDREGLAVVFGVKKFHYYLYGRDFSITTDHKPLLGLFKENKATPALASSRIQRWSLTLAAYRYQLLYKSGPANANADGFSRLPLPVKPETTPEPADFVFVMDHMEGTPVNADKIKLWIGRDPCLAWVRDFVANGWPQVCNDPELKPFFTRKDELSLHHGCLMWGARVVIPPQGRKLLLDELHDTHPGMVKMKALARSYLWWPGIDHDLETLCKECTNCQSLRKAPPKAPLHPWEYPTRPWSRLHIDYAGPKLGHMFLVVVDARTKWLEVILMKTATSATTIEKLRAMFAVHGLPDTIVSDNGSVFTSTEFAEFTKFNGIRHVKVAPFHPSSNGLAERAVQTFKASLDKMTDTASIDTKVSRFLFQYRITPHSTTGQAPAEMLMQRKNSL